MVAIFADDILSAFSSIKNYDFLLRKSLKFIPKDPPDKQPFGGGN